LAKVIVVTSGKGGVGKSNVSLNIAYTLSKSSKTLLLDADLGMGDIGFLLGMNFEYDLTDYFYRNKIKMADIIYQYSTLFIVTSGSGDLDAVNLRDSYKRSFYDLFKLFMKKFDYIVIDTSPGISKNTMLFLDLATEIIFLSSLELPSLMDCYQQIKVFNSINLVCKKNVLFNIVKDLELSSMKFNVLQHSVSKFLNSELNFLGSLKNDSSIGLAVEEQIPFVSLFPKSFNTKIIRSISNNL